ncbi:MAG TPA: hypothetical protein DEP57_02355 [Selenomonas sp.]|nr:hypothetical protein [Selenomonas sp.]
MLCKTFDKGDYDNYNESIEIPVIPMDKQQEMVTAYQKLAQELKNLKAREKTVIEKINALMNG